MLVALDAVEGVFVVARVRQMGKLWPMPVSKELSPMPVSKDQKGAPFKKILTVAMIVDTRIVRGVGGGGAGTGVF